MRCTRPIRLPLVAALAAGALAGCHMGPAYHPPQPPAAPVATYKELPAPGADSTWQPARPSDAMLRGNWWEVFDEPELNALEQRLNINNQNIKQFFQNFMAARALVAEARANYYPTVTAGFGASAAGGSRGNNGSNNSSLGNGTSTGTPSGTSGTGANANSGTLDWSLPISATWEPDLWGKIRNEVRAAEYSAQISAADLENEKLSEQAMLAQLFFQIRGQDALKQMLDQTVADDQKALDLAQALYHSGINPQTAVLQAQTALRSAIADDTATGVLRAQYENAIAVEVGEVASGFHIPVRAALYRPPSIPTGMPSQLVQRRPDVAAAERALARDNAQIGIGYGAFFPQLTISADAGFASSSLKKLFNAASRFWSVGPNFSQVLYNGGLYRAQLHQYQATYNADLAAYRESVLVAFQQVEDALAAVRLDSDEIQQQQAAVQYAQSLLTLELARYRTGIDPYLNVLTAQTTLLGARQTLLNVQVQCMVSSVQLVQALGGGWDASQLPSPGAVAAPAPAVYGIQH